MSDIRLKKITVEPSEILTIQNGIVNITNTTSSDTSITGALVINGGLGIRATGDSSNSTTGGAITVAGGIGITKSAQIGNNLTLDTTTGLFTIKGLSTNRLFVDSVVNKTITMAPDGVNNRFELYDTYISLNTTKTSTNASSAGLVINGGISINCTTNVGSTTEGGALTIAGGASIFGNLAVGSNISATNLNITTNISSSNLYISSITSNNLLIGGSISTGTLNVSSGITTSSLFVSSNLSSSNILATNATINSAIITSLTGSNINLSNSLTTGSLLITNSQITFVTGGASQVTVNIQDNQALRFGSNSAAKSHVLVVGNNFSGGGRVAIRYSNFFTADYVDGTAPTVMTLLNSSGQLGIGTTSPTFKLDVNGDARITTGLTTATILATTSISSGALYSANLSSSNIVGTNISASTLNLTNINTSSATIGTLLSNSILVTNGSLSATFNSNTLGSIFTTGGNVGINCTAPAAALHISNLGRLRFSSASGQNYSEIYLGTNDFIVNGKSAGNLVLQSNANDSSQGIFLQNSSSASVLSMVEIGTGRIGIFNTAPSYIFDVNGSVGMNSSVIMSSTTNSTGVGTGGVLTIKGGASLDKDLYIGGILVGTNVTSATLRITSTSEALNLSSGSIITDGGITIKCSTDASSITNGGSLLTKGGASIGGKLYVGNNNYINGSSSYYSSTNDNINFMDNSNIKRFSIDLDTSSKNYSISRYNSSGVFIEKSMDINNSTGSITLNNTITSTASNSASLIIAGGVSIAATTVATALGNGGTVTIMGGTAISKNVLIGGNTRMYSTTESNDVSSGALIIDGGVGISKNLNVLGNTVLNGNLTVRGTTTSVISTTTTLNDNIVLLNSGPSGTKDSGYIIQRYQLDNDSGSGDVVNDSTYITDVLPLQGGVTSTQVKLSSSASASDNYYVGWWIKVVTGFVANQVRQITGYVGSTRTATISSAWTTSNPSSGDTVYLYNKPYVGLIYNEVNDRFQFGSSVTNPSDSVTFTDELPIYSKSLTCTSTQSSTNPTTGCLLLSGGISINSSVDATSITNGGTLTSLGGGSIGKTLYVGTGLYVNGVNMTPNSQDIFTSVSINASNNQSSPVNISGLSFTSGVWGFDVFLTARVTATSNLYTNFHLRGVNKSTSWDLVKSYVGDDTGIEFSITSGGQIQYTTPNFAGFTSLVFKWRGLVN